MRQLALCHTCRHQHTIEFDPVFGAGALYSDWLVKHAGHVIEIRSPRRRQRDAEQLDKTWESYISNADVKIAYGATTTPTCTLASLAASSTLLGGRESTAIDNGVTNKYLDYYLAGHYGAAATTNQAGSIRTAVVGAQGDVITWPDVFDGTDSVETVSKAGVYDAVCRLLSEIAADATASQVWPFGPCSIAAQFGGICPDNFLFFISHNIQTTTNVWHATEGTHSLKLTGVYATVI